jgi:RNA polymerase sigma factor (sigma-70 family)
MSDETVSELHGLIERIRRGDPDAPRALLERACGRLRKLAAHIFTASFPALAGRHEVDSVVHETWLRLAQAMESVRPASVEHFTRLAAQKVRQVLLDLVERQRRQRSREAVGFSDGSSGPAIAAGQTHDPERLALWAEFHEKISGLPEEERAVFEMHYYLELPQAEIAHLLGLHPRKVSRLWVAATERLADGVAGLAGLA